MVFTLEKNNYTKKLDKYDFHEYFKRWYFVVNIRRTIAYKYMYYIIILYNSLINNNLCAF